MPTPAALTQLQMMQQMAVQQLNYAQQQAAMWASTAATWQQSVNTVGQTISDCGDVIANGGTPSPTVITTAENKVADELISGDILAIRRSFGSLVQSVGRAVGTLLNR